MNEQVPFFGEKIKIMQVKFLIFLLMFFLPVFFINAQTQNNENSTVFNTSGFPQWAKDLRRWEIVAFGTYPFTMFATIFSKDTYRWIEQGMDWSDEGRRYAPWPLKSACAVDMTNKQYEMTMAIAAGVSVTLALVDLIIVNIKRNRIRHIAENLPAGTTIITRNPWPPEADNEKQYINNDNPE